MSRWILLISCVCLIAVEARRMDHRDHKHHVSSHVTHENHSPQHLDAKRAESNEETSDEDSEEKSTSSENSKEKNKNVCEAEACLQTAEFIKKSMDDSVDPCEDFHKYACGNWVKHYKIPSYMARWSAWDLLTTTANNQQRELLSKEVQHDDILPLRLSKKWYQSCINTDELERKSVRPLLNVVARIGGWPMAMEPNEWDESSFPWQRVDKYYARLTGSPTFVKNLVVPDWMMMMFNVNETRSILQIESLVLPLEDFESDVDFKRSPFYTGTDYKRLIEETATAILKERGADVSRDTITKDIEDMLKFEKSLYKIFKGDESLDEPSSDEKDSNEDKTSDGDSKSSEGNHEDKSDEDRDNTGSNNDSDDDSNNDSNEGSNNDSNEGSADNSDDDESEDQSNNSNASNSSLGNNSDDEDSANDSDNEDSANDSDNSVSNDSNDEASTNDIDNNTSNDSNDEDNESENNSSANNESNDIDNDDDDDDDSDSDVTEESVRKIRRHTKKRINKRTKKFLRRRILSEYSDEDEDKAEEEAEEEIMKMTLWGNSIEAIVKEVNLKMSDVNIRDLVNMKDLKELYSLIEKTPKRTVVNYIHWKYISGMVQHTTEELRKLHFNVAGKTLGRTEEKPRWLWCLDQVGTKEVISYEYVKNYFPNDAKEIASSIIRRIRQVINNKIDKSPWMSKKLKKAAKAKVNAMKAEVGYPSWYDNSTAIERYYKGLAIDREYFDNMLNFQKYDYMKKLRKIIPSSMSVWSVITPLTVNAIYMPSANSLTITAADFQRPFFDVSQPAAINFGIIGYVIGHEISHGFDPMGRYFDKDGKGQMWGRKDERNYQKREICFVKKYSAYTLELKELNTTIRVNGRATVGDNVADCMGLQAVHGAYRMWREEQKDKEDLKLPGLEKFSNDQLFYLASAAMWCDTATPEYAKFLTRRDSHSPMSIRILGALSNSVHFGDAFNCPKGSPMNPEKKCSIWK